jgi:tetratricopeptide (TPR) repeat protein
MNRNVIWLVIIFAVAAFLFNLRFSPPKQSLEEVANRGFDLLIEGKAEESIRMLDRAFSMSRPDDPRSAHLLGAKATAYEALDKPEEALECYEEIFRLKNPDPRAVLVAYVNESILLNKLGRGKEAATAIETAKSMVTDPEMKKQIETYKIGTDKLNAATITLPPVSR